MGNRDPRAHEFSVQLRAMDNERTGAGLGLPVLVALCSGLLEKSVKDGLIAVGALNLGGSVEPLANAVGIVEAAMDSRLRGDDDIEITGTAQAGGTPVSPGYLDSRFRGKDRDGGNDGRRGSDVSRSNDVIPAEAGIHFNHALRSPEDVKERVEATPIRQGPAVVGWGARQVFMAQPIGREPGRPTRL